MDLQTSQPSVVPPKAAGTTMRPAYRLSGRRLKVARLIHGAVFVSTVCLFLLAVPIRQERLVDTFRNLSPAQALVLAQLGVSGEQHAGMVLAIEVLVPLLFFSTGLLIYWRRSDDWVAMLVSASLATYVCWPSPVLDSLAADEAWRIPAVLVQVLGMTGALAFFYVFPDGRFVPRITVPLLGAWWLWGLAWLLLPGSEFDLSDPFRLSVTSFVALLAWLGTGFGAQVYRFIMVATPLQRQQTKLVLFGMTIAMLGYVVFGFNRFAFPLLAQPLFANVVYDLIGVPIFLLIVLVIPISFGVSILRYRLWDIDLFINRALVYGALTAVLAGLYTASVAFSQRAFVALTGEKSDAAIVLTTLVVASAFTPVKTHLQNIVDRYVKPRPDPIKEVRAFGDQIRAFIQMLDVEELTARVCEDAVRAFDASGGAVYLKRDGRFQMTHASGDWEQVEGMTVWMEDDHVQHGWIVLGPRRTGLPYNAEDQKLFTEMVELACRTITLVGKTGFGGLSTRSDRHLAPTGS